MRDWGILDFNVDYDDNIRFRYRKFQLQIKIIL